MQTYILKRLLLTIPMLIGISFISLFVMSLAPGRAGTGGGGDGSQSNKITRQQQEIMERTFHLNKPIHERYLYWMGIWQNEPTDTDLAKAKSKIVNMRLFGKEIGEREPTMAEVASMTISDAEIKANIPKTGVLYGDFGNSMAVHSEKVWDRISSAIPVTLLFNLLSFMLIYLFAIPIGIFSATHQDSKLDKGITVGLFGLYSMPNFWVGLLLMTLVVSLPRIMAIPVEGWAAPLIFLMKVVLWPMAWLKLPIQGIHPENSSQLTLLEWLAGSVKYFILPLMVFTYQSFAGMSRYMRSSMIDTIRSDYVRTARAKGLREFLVVYKHALRNSLIPIITLLGSELPALFSGSVIIENLFGIPGMGKVAFEALITRDYTVLMADLVLVAVLVMCGFLISDLLYKLADPRITFEDAGK